MSSPLDFDLLKANGDGSVSRAALINPLFRGDTGSQ